MNARETIRVRARHETDHQCGDIERIDSLVYFHHGNEDAGTD